MRVGKNETLGFGLIGAGMIAGFHAKAIQAASRQYDIRLMGVWGKTQEQTAEFASKNEIPFYTTQLDELLERQDIHVVCIVTPSGAHLEPALKAIHAGKHVIIEKPLEITIERVDAMIEAAQMAGVKISAIFQARFASGAQAVKKALESDRFGRLCLCSAYVKWHRTEEYYSGWKGTLALDGGGAVMNQAIHALDLLHWFAGMPYEVYAWATRAVHKKIEAEDTACATFKFPNGALGVFEATTGAYPGWERRIEICGERGSVSIEDDRIVRWEFMDTQPEDEILRGQQEGKNSSSGAAAPDQISYHGHQKQIEEMVEAIRLGRPLSVDVKEARNTVALVCGIYQSAEEHLPIKVDAL
ncbi:Gfo/Idh/MocA family protein [Paraburkholderia sp. HP33-1]|uniref:Gfo/Idh/MocA family protein n=1 Tax=Paraburkholderia sp. HP33-1 TaxID=2883243 RepID=UPI001F432354|nr:Gfo/Idh/MocA family oxidoreductase [Paraburkholderia sp. HP33-1]